MMDIDPSTLEKLNDAFTIAEENTFVADVKAKFERTGTLSQNQINAVIRVKEKFDVEFIAPLYSIGQHIEIIGKVVRVESVEREVAHNMIAKMTRYVITDDMGVMFYITTGAKKITSFLNLMEATKEDFKFDGVVQWRPDNSKMPVIMSKKGLTLHIIEDRNEL